MNNATPTCPAWCTITAEEHAQEASRLVPGDRPLHKSIEHNGFQFWALGDDGPTATISRTVSHDDNLTAVQLRELAANTAAAAEWLEAHKAH